MSDLKRTVTRARAEKAARLLFPYDHPETLDCRTKNCPMCAYRKDEWERIVTNVRNAMMEAFR